MSCHVYLPCFSCRSRFGSWKSSDIYLSFQTELSAEAKAALLEFEERERQHKQGRYGSRRGGRRGGSVVCRAMGDQRRDSSERARIKDHRPALLPTQPPGMVRVSFTATARDFRTMKVCLHGFQTWGVSPSLKLRFYRRNNGKSFFTVRSHLWSKFTRPGIRVVGGFCMQLLTEKEVTRGLYLQGTRATGEPGFCPPRL